MHDGFGGCDAGLSNRPTLRSDGHCRGNSSPGDHGVRGVDCRLRTPTLAARCLAWHFISSTPLATTGNGYNVTVSATGVLALNKRTGNADTALASTAAAYIAIDTDYDIAVTRNATGVFVVYVRTTGAWAAALTTAADLTYVTSAHMLIANETAGAKVCSTTGNGLPVLRGVVSPVTNPEVFG